MNEVMLFSNPEFGSVRAVLIDGKEYFYGIDVARALKYERPSKAVTDNCKGVLVQDTIKNGGGFPEKLITEGDMYRLIVKASVQSNSKTVRDAAEIFEKWIFDEVLPEIRRTGSYSVKKKKTESYLIEDPIARAERWIEEQKEKRLLEEKNQYLEETVEEQRPKAEYFDALVDDNLLTNFRDTAKELGLSQTEFVGWLLDKEYVYKDRHGIIKPYEPHRKRGLFAMKDFMNPNSGFTGVRTYVTVKGKNTFRLLLQIP